LKTWPEYWISVESGAKNFEVRRNDRSFQPGDTLWLREWNPDAQDYTGRSVTRRIDYVLRDAERFGVQPGFVVLGLRAARSAAGTPTPKITDVIDTVWDSLNDSTNHGTEAYTYAHIERAVRDALPAGSGTAALTDITDDLLPDPDDEDEHGPVWESPAGRVRVENGHVFDVDIQLDSSEAEIRGRILIAAARWLAADGAGDGGE
jgi:hypothetical protein